MARDKKITFSRRLFAALEKYFLTKAANKGMFPDKATKEAICKEICDAAPKFNVTIYPGLIELVDAKSRSVFITDKTLVGTVVFESNPLMPWEKRPA